MTVAAGALDGMLVVCMTAFAAMLRVRRASPNAVRAQAFVSVGHLLRTLARLFAGSGAFYVAAALACGARCAACVSWCHWCDTEGLSVHWTRSPMAAFSLLATLLGALFGLGCAVCAVGGLQPSTCATLAAVDETLLHALWGGAWALVSVRVAMLLRDAPRIGALSASERVHLFGVGLRCSLRARLRLLHAANAVAPLALLSHAVGDVTGLRELVSSEDVVAERLCVCACALTICGLALNVPRLHQETLAAKEA
jgi:hypothetical protein